MQEHTHTTSLLLLKKKNEHKVLVICARSKNNIKESKKTQGSFWSLREDFLTQRVATLIIILIKKKLQELNYFFT